MELNKRKTILGEMKKDMKAILPCIPLALIAKYGFHANDYITMAVCVIPALFLRMREEL